MKYYAVGYQMGQAGAANVVLLMCRCRLEDEKREALGQQKGMLTRTHETDLTRAERERDEDHRRIQQEYKMEQEKLKAEIRRETTK